MFCFYSLENAKKKFTFQIIQIKIQDFSQEREDYYDQNRMAHCSFSLPKAFKEV